MVRFYGRTSSPRTIPNRRFKHLALNPFQTGGIVTRSEVANGLDSVRNAVVGFTVFWNWNIGQPGPFKSSNSRLRSHHRRLCGNDANDASMNEIDNDLLRLIVINEGSGTSQRECSQRNFTSAPHSCCSLSVAVNRKSCSPLCIHKSPVSEAQKLACFIKYTWSELYLHIGMYRSYRLACLSFQAILLPTANRRRP